MIDTYYQITIDKFLKFKKKIVQSTNRKHDNIFNLVVGRNFFLLADKYCNL